MKNYHAVGISICSAVIITCALSLTDTVHAATGTTAAVSTTIMGLFDVKPAHTCPAETQFNTGFVVTDENNDGTADHMYKVFNSGPCVGQLVGPNDNGTSIKG